MSRLRAVEAVELRDPSWLHDDVFDVFAYCNNDYGGHAVTDAEWLARRLQPAIT